MPLSPFNGNVTSGSGLQSSGNRPAPVSREERDRAAAIKDGEIDFSDIPEIKDLSGLRPRPPVDRGMYRPVKAALTCRLDADIAAWLKQGGKGYQTRLNSILRQIMDRSH